MRRVAGLLAVTAAPPVVTVARPLSLQDWSGSRPRGTHAQPPALAPRGLRSWSPKAQDLPGARACVMDSSPSPGDGAGHPWRRESVTVESSDGVRLSVEVFPGVPPTGQVSSLGPAVVLVHQYSLLGGSQALMRGLALELNAHHFSCITFDMRGVGKSTGRATLTGHKETEDVAAVCRWAAQRYGGRLLLLGSSAGAPLAGSALDAVPEVDAFVAIGYTFGRWAAVLFGRHFSAVLASRKPKLFIMGTADGFTSVAQLRGRLRAATGGASEEHLVEGRGHFELEGPAFDAYMATVVAHFMQRLALREGLDRAA